MLGKSIFDNKMLYIKKFSKIFIVIGMIQLVMNILSKDVLVANFEKVFIFAIFVSMVEMRSEHVKNRKS
ncbi:hypothetical protein GCM10025884_09120 [Leuconostoc gelidum subsp. gelidum]|nr:hypothetical protein C269_00160 [Leuconostoc gelidum JB7]GMA67285.1 hypothetical protein GCM10025884_09120 [Leuconostoc gelidum subsp. gelidum]